MTIRIIDKVLKDDDLGKITEILKDVKWEDGKNTAHGELKNKKNNNQLITPCEELNQINSIILSRLKSNELIRNIVLPTYIVYPMINKFSEGQFYGKHIDRPIRLLKEKNTFIRNDVSMTLFLNEPECYDGGRLIIYDGSVIQKIKLSKGSSVIYPTSYIHEVEKVTRGERLACVTWMQSGIADLHERSIVNDSLLLANSLSMKGEHELAILANKVYSNLIKKFSKF